MLEQPHHDVVHCDVAVPSDQDLLSWLLIVAAVIAAAVVSRVTADAGRETPVIIINLGPGSSASTDFGQ